MERNNQRLVDALYRFMKRDYSEDVRELNRALAETETADLRSEAPPIPFTGDPWSKVKHECTLLVGINPKWHEPGSKTGQYETEIANSIALINQFREGDDGAFAEYIEQRKEYFRGGGEYKGHYTYISNRFLENWYETETNLLWEKFVMNLDVIPWFSDKTKAISNENLVDEYRNNSALSDYVNIIEEVIELIQPKRIHLNGVPPRLVFESVFGIEFKPLKLIDKSIGMYVGHLIVRNVEYPVLAHNFGKTQSGPNSIVQWKSMADKYEAWDNS